MKCESLESLLTIEDDPALMNFVCHETGTPIWPAMRNQVLRLVLSHVAYGAQPLVDPSVRHGRPPSFRAAFLAFAHNLRTKPSPSRVLIHASGRGVLRNEDGAYNKFTDGFASALDHDSWSMEGVTVGPVALPRVNQRTSFTLDGKIAATVHAVARARSYRAQIEPIVELVAGRCADRQGWRMDDAARASLVEFGARQVASNAPRKSYFQRYLDRTKPRLFLVDQGCYGTTAALNLAARERGIPVAEYQHGVVSRGHTAYNYAPTLLRSAEFVATLPDFFLSYGDWWNGQFNAPVEKVTIGSPHREMRLRELDSPAGGNVKSVLVLGDGVETDMYMEFCHRLSRLLPNSFAVRFRPHPHEVRRAIRARTQVSVDETPDIYQSLADTDVLVSEVSTGLFEAAGLVERIFVWDTPKSRFSLPVHPFESIDSSDQLAETLVDSSAPLGIDVSDIWASNWRTRFIEFVDGATR